MKTLGLFISDIYNHVSTSGISIYILIIVYAVVIIGASGFHEVWRDEARVLNYAVESSSIGALTRSLHHNNEGHPSAWYILMYVAYAVVHSPAVLKAVNVTIMIGSMFLFLRKAPFPFFIKGMFLFSYVPVFVFAVWNRSYSLCMLLLFLTAYWYPSRNTHRIRFSVVLFLLANTHAIGAVIAGVFCVSFFRELFDDNQKDYLEIMGSAGIVGFGILVAYLQAFPDRSTAVTSMFLLHGSDVWRSFLYAVLHIGDLLKNLVFFNSPFIAGMVLLLLIIYVMKNKILAFIAAASLVCINWLFTVVYSGHLMHQGLVFVFIICILWMYDSTMLETNTWKKGTVYGLLFLILIPHVAEGWHSINAEISNEYSSSKQCGQLFNRLPLLKNATVVSEPDYITESLFYYAPDIRNYLPREDRFSRIPRFTLQSRQVLSLEELLAAARKIHAASAQPVVIILGHRLNPQGPFQISIPHEQIFSFSEYSLRQLHEHTIKIASFRTAFTDEQYDLYLLM